MSFVQLELGGSFGQQPRRRRSKRPTDDWGLLPTPNEIKSHKVDHEGLKAMAMIIRANLRGDREKAFKIGRGMAEKTRRPEQASLPFR